MKRGFTLIEMLIVVALIATLMTIVLRLGSVSSESSNRNTTILRLSKLENCLSGYYAAYGNYPPVRLHNTRDIYREVDGHGVQTDEVNENIWNWTEIGTTEETEAWKQVEAACRAQPVGAEFPFAATDAVEADVNDFRDQLQANLATGEFKNYPKSGTKEYDAASAGFDSLRSNLGRFSNASTAYSWRDIQVFKFGMMSFLLPRYQMMMAGKKELYTSFAQWTKNNGAVSNPMTGEQYDWEKLNEINERIDNNSASTDEKAQLENIPADAICARWMPNLENVCAGSKPELKFFGINVIESDGDSAYLLNVTDDPSSAYPPVHIYSPAGDSQQNQYILDAITVRDGWGEEFYYYSPTPHQSYQLWSSGANKRTFPPWVPRAQLGTKAGECIYQWTQDDIRGLSN